MLKRVWIVVSAIWAALWIFAVAMGLYEGAQPKAIAYVLPFLLFLIGPPILAVGRYVAYGRFTKERKPERVTARWVD